MTNILGSVPHLDLVSVPLSSTENRPCAVAMLLLELNFKGKGKGNGDLYSAYRETSKALRHGSHTFTCKLHHAWIYLVSVHQMAPTLTCDNVRLIAPIDPERMKG